MRLPAAPWTPEDGAIQWRVIVRGDRASGLDCRPWDRRDADIMLSAQRNPGLLALAFGSGCSIPLRSGTPAVFTRQRGLP